MRKLWGLDRLIHPSSCIYQVIRLGFKAQQPELWNTCSESLYSPAFWLPQLNNFISLLMAFPASYCRGGIKVEFPWLGDHPHLLLKIKFLVQLVDDQTLSHVVGLGGGGSWWCWSTSVDHFCLLWGLLAMWAEGTSVCLHDSTLYIAPGLSDVGQNNWRREKCSLQTLVSHFVYALEVSHC